MSYNKFYNKNTPPTASSPEGTYYVKNAEDATLMDIYVVSNEVVKKQDKSETAIAQLAGKISKIGAPARIRIFTKESSFHHYEITAFDLIQKPSEGVLGLYFEGIESGDVLKFEAVGSFVEWGDGTNGAYDKNTGHTYTSDGDYHIYILGLSNISYGFLKNAENKLKLISVEVPDSFTGIGQEAFSGSGLTNFNMSGFVEAIGKSAFQNCTALKSIHIPNGNASIPDTFAQGCTNLETAVIPAECPSIGYRAFNLDSALKTINIPESVASIGERAFEGCSSLISVYMNSATPPTLGNSVFNNTPPTLKIYIPTGSLAAYQTASGWSAYASKLIEY
jgi:hypothetical protein